MKSKNRLSTSIILMVEIILLISSVLFCTVSVFRARVGIRKAIQQRMLDIANCASGSVDGDALEALTEADVGGKVYGDIYNTLAVFRDNVELEYVYCIREEADGQFIFTMDLDLYTPASFGDSVKYTDALASAGRGTAAVDEVPYSDAWGTFYSAYSPVFDASRKVAGIVAVDFSAEWFDGQLSAQTRSTVASYVIILLLSLLVAAVLSMLTVRPFVRMQGKLLEEKVHAESANRAKSDFLANMSHEIRTPINTMLGMNEMILREERQAQNHTNDKQAMDEALKRIDAFANDAESAGQNLLAIVNDILDFSKIEAGRMRLVEAPYQLGSVLNDVSSMVFVKARAKALDYVIDVDPSIPDALLGDELRVRQVFTNLLTNAVKYTDRGSVTLTLRGEKRADGTLLLTASVRDTGIGIRAEDFDKLFTRFERLDMARNNTVEGTGLGLVITKRLLDMMGGSITVESEYGKGSVFTVKIPQKIVSEAPIGDFQARFSANVMASGTYRESFRAPNARVLIVDDTKMNLTVAVNLLKNTEIRIDTATCGADAVLMAETTAYDVILMDQRMPEMDGTEALKRIRALNGGASQNAPVVCLTADAVAGARERYLAEGFSDYLTKPINSLALEKILIKYLPPEKVERVHAAQEAASPAAEPAGAASPGAEPADGFAALRAAGVDTRTGLKYCQEDEALYRELLAEYARGHAEKAELMEGCLATEDWNDYAVHVHALKSTSKMIGALTLSERAAALEAAANAGDGEAIRAGHPAMMEGYGALARAISSVIPPHDSPTEDDGIMEFSPEDDILEFKPEGD